MAMAVSRHVGSRTRSLSSELTYFLDTVKMYENHRFLPTRCQRYADNGPTFEVSTLGTPTVCSCEPANLLRVLSTNAKAWGVAYRLSTIGPYLGRGFLTTDGPAWEYSRTLVAPSFHRANVSSIAPTMVNNES